MSPEFQHKIRKRRNVYKCSCQNMLENCLVSTFCSFHPFTFKSLDLAGSMISEALGAILTIDRKEELQGL